MKNNKAKQIKLVSVGTVVLLNGGIKEIMIYGRNVIRIGKNEMYDYVGCLFPEGYIGDNYNIFFDNKDIKKITRVLTSDLEKIELESKKLKGE